MYIQVREDGLGSTLPAAQEVGALTVATIIKRGLILLVVAAIAYALWRYFNGKKGRRRNRRR